MTMVSREVDQSTLVVQKYDVVNSMGHDSSLDDVHERFCIRHGCRKPRVGYEDRRHRGDKTCSRNSRP